MKSATNPIRTVAGSVLQKTCRETCCRQPIDLRLTPKTRMNGRGQVSNVWMPFQRGAVPLHVERDERGVSYAFMSSDDLHFKVCKKRQAAARPGASA